MSFSNRRGIRSSEIRGWPATPSVKWPASMIPPESGPGWKNGTGGSEGDVDRSVGLLEMERNALRIFTSCAWFFDDLAGVEQVQILRYAARALELVEAVGGPVDDLRAALLEALSSARSNEEEARTGDRFYLEDVVPPVPVTAYAAARHLAGLPAVPGPWEIRNNEGERSVSVRHRGTGEEARFEEVDGGDVEPSASSGASSAVRLKDGDGRMISVDPGATWP